MQKFGREPPVAASCPGALRSTPRTSLGYKGRVLSSASEDDEEPAPVPLVSSALSRRADLPAVIAKAAAILGVPLPASPPVEEEDPWDVGPYAKRMKARP